MPAAERAKAKLLEKYREYQNHSDEIHQKLAGDLTPEERARLSAEAVWYARKLKWLKARTEGAMPHTLTSRPLLRKIAHQDLARRDAFKQAHRGREGHAALARASTPRAPDDPPIQ